MRSTTWPYETSWLIFKMILRRNWTVIYVLLLEKYFFKNNEVIKHCGLLSVMAWWVIAQRESSSIPAEIRIVQGETVIHMKNISLMVFEGVKVFHCLCLSFLPLAQERKKKKTSHEYQYVIKSAVLILFLAMAPTFIVWEQLRISH